MVDLLIIADDFTGALDTGVQFTKKGAVTCVVTDTELDYNSLKPDIQVLSLDAETRHMTADEAYQIVRKVVSRALEAGIPYIYKKTDSALRGNIGAELGAMRDAAGVPISFVPAYPKINRVTVDGIHYIDGVPVGESVFGLDPFEPVCSSRVSEIISKQTELEGITIYDAETMADMKEIARELDAEGHLNRCAGCAGLAELIAEKLGYSHTDRPCPDIPEKLLVACGSVNPITVAQLQKAEQDGISRNFVNVNEKFDKSWLNSKEAKERISQWRHILDTEGVCIVDSNDPCGRTDTIDYAREHGISLDDLRVTIASVMGGIVKEMLDGGLSAAMLITGGDTLLGFMEQVHVSILRPISELLPGVVLSKLEYQGVAHYVISKSGGFGQKTLIEDLVRLLNSQKEIIC